MVTNDGTPRLLDFGIAKLLDPDAPQEMLAQTRPTERLLTPEYASPEQIRGEPITTAVDVYALGVLLYELLAGRNPFAPLPTSPIEITRKICEFDPPPPSSAASLDVGTSPAEIRKLKGDLDHIALMAMRKEPGRRYVSVAQLAGDVTAYLEGYPILARNDTWSYRSAKFVKRHWVGVTTAAFIALVLIAFSAVMAMLMERANRATLRAERESEISRRHVSRGYAKWGERGNDYCARTAGPRCPPDRSRTDR